MAIFVDTGAWFAATVPLDPDHTAARSYLDRVSDRLVTSNLVYAEFLTLYRVRGRIDRAHEWVAELKSGLAQVVTATDSDIRAATDIFFAYADKRWSFTDCVSRVMMQRLGISQAFAFDEHFRQFGTVTVVP